MVPCRAYRHQCKGPRPASRQLRDPVACEELWQYPLPGRGIQLSERPEGNHRVLLAPELRPGHELVQGTGDIEGVLCKRHSGHAEDAFQRVLPRRARGRWRNRVPQPLLAWIHDEGWTSQELSLIHISEPTRLGMI